MLLGYLLSLIHLLFTFLVSFVFENPFGSTALSALWIAGCHQLFRSFDSFSLSNQCLYRISWRSCIASAFTDGIIICCISWCSKDYTICTCIYILRLHKLGCCLSGLASHFLIVRSVCHYRCRMHWTPVLNIHWQLATLAQCEPINEQDQLYHSTRSIKGQAAVAIETTYYVRG